MNDKTDGSGPSSLASLVQISELGIDHLSDLRQMHVSGFNAIGGSIYTEDEIQAFQQHVYSNAYADRLLNATTYLAWIDEHLVGTSSWCPVGDDRTTARIADLFVDPLFSRQGIGRLMLQHCETAAANAGYLSFVARAGYHAVPTFQKAGYVLSAQGIYQLTDDVPLAVGFMRKAVGSESG